MKTIFIAGPYSSDPVGNTGRAMEVVHKLMDLGYAPFCPHLTHFLHLHRWRAYEEWLALDMVYLEKCDALLRLTGHSSGADKEVMRADELGMRVYFKIEDIPDRHKKEKQKPRNNSFGEYLE